MAKYKGKFATNFKKRQICKHKEEFEDCDKAEKTRGANNTRTGRMSTGNNGKYYQPSTLLQFRIFLLLAILIGATNAPFSLVDSEEFCALLHEMDKNISRTSSKISFSLTNSIVVEQSHNH